MTFSVTDTGIGIEREKLKTIFESFTQVHIGDARKYGGTGLGLTISRNLVELFGGKLEVESEANAGSVFSFTIPFEISSEEEYEAFHLQKEGFSADDLFGLKILVAEDNEHNQLVTVDTLKKVIDDVEVDVVKNGREALDALNRQSTAEGKPYDLILMDVQMPEMDGYEATRQIRNHKSAIRNSNIPIIALTASVVRSDLVKCIEAGMNSYIPKPFTKEDLVKEIGRVLQRSTKGNRPAIADHSPYIFRQSPESGGVNFKHLKQISDGDTQKMKEYLEQFLSLVSSRLQRLKTALEKENRDEIYHAAHTLKPQISFFGMKREELIANTIEMKVHEISQDELSDLVSQLEAGCNAAMQEIENELKRII